MAGTQKVCVQIWGTPCFSKRLLPASFSSRPNDIQGRTVFRVRCSYLPKPSTPPYYEYLSRSAIQREYVKGWLKTTATEDVTMRERATVGSTLVFVPSCIKYYLTPLIVRYVVYLLWRSLRRHVLYPIQKRVVRLDCMIDAYLAKIGAGGKDVGFSYGATFARFHGRIGVLGDLVYRFHLLTGGSLGSWRKVYITPKSKFVKYDEFGEEEEEEKEEGEIGYYLDPDLDYGPLKQKRI